MIFDLDDTLIETSKCLTPRALTRAFEAMCAAGMKAKEGAIEELFLLNETALSACDALLAFSVRYPQGKHFFKIGANILNRAIEEDISVDPVPHAFKVLNVLGGLHYLALVTRGEESLQLEKMEKAGIQPERFSKLIVSRAPSKKGDYEATLNFFGCSPEECVVCGDRVSLDLTPAKELGLYTVHFRNGRGLHHADPAESVDVTIDCLTELEEVLAKYEV